MHTCFLCSEYPPAPHGGIGTFTQTLGRALVARGQMVSVVGVYAVERETVETDRGVRVVRLPHARVRGGGFALNGRRLRAALRRIHEERPIDLIEGQENSLAMLPARFVAPRIIRLNGGHQFFARALGRKPGLWRSWLERRSFERADFVCGVSRYVSEQTSELLHLDAAAIEILPNPVDTSLFCARMPARSGDASIVFVGTVAEKKGVRQLVQAMPEIIAAVPAARLRIVGPDSRIEGTGESYTEALRRTIPPDVASRIEFTGRVENTALPDILAAATVCVYPSHMEALPIAFLEGMAMARPVVASRTGPGPEVIEDGVSGLLCDPHDPRSIAAQVIRVLTDRTLQQTLARNAAAAVASRFSIDVLADRNLQWYRRCVERYRTRAC